VGFIFQSFNLIPSMTAQENVAFPMQFSRVPRRQRRQRAMELLKDVALDDRASHRPTELSGGQQQRVAIARALANDAPLILADEPTGRLDSITAGSILEIFSRLVQDGRTILMVTHDETLAEQVSRRIQIVDGELSGDERQPAGAETYAS
jgi:putative ABC transport system ATP-binding protein